MENTERRGRPAKAAKDKFKLSSIRMPPAEKRKIKRAAKIASESFSEFIRGAANNRADEVIEEKKANG